MILKRQLILAMMGSVAIVAVARADNSIDARLQAALVEVSYLSFDNGYTLFKGVMADALPNSEQWQAAVYGTAVCAQEILPSTSEKTDEARKLYRLLLDKTPQSKFSPRALLNLGRIDELSGGGSKQSLESARTLYLQVVEKWPELPIAGEATMRAAAAYVQSYDADQVQKGVGMLTDWLKAHPKDELASAMWEYLGDTYFYPLVDYQKSLDAYEKADHLGWVDNTNEGKTFWRIAVMSERYLKNRDMAVKYYTMIITRTPTSGKAYEAQIALRRLNAPVPAITIFKMDASSPSPTTQPAPGGAP